jgi:hypothetical protein
MRKPPAYRMIPLNVAHSACKTGQNAQKNLPLIAFLPLIGVRLYVERRKNLDFHYIPEVKVDQILHNAPVLLQFLPIQSTAAWADIVFASHTCLQEVNSRHLAVL